MPVARLLPPLAAGFAARVTLQAFHTDCFRVAGAWLTAGARMLSAAAGASSSAAGDESLEFLMAVLKEVPGVTAVKDSGTEGGIGQYRVDRRATSS